MDKIEQPLQVQNCKIKTRHREACLGINANVAYIDFTQDQQKRIVLVQQTETNLALSQSFQLMN